MDIGWKKTLMYVLLGFILGVTLPGHGSSGGKRRERGTSYADLLKEVSYGRVERIEVRELGHGTFRFKAFTRDHSLLTGVVIGEYANDVFDAATGRKPAVDVEYSSAKTDFPWWTVVIGGLVLYYIVTSSARSIGFDLFKTGGPPNPVVVPETSRVTFADVAGVDEAEQELQELVQHLKDPERLKRLGGLPPRGTLLVGPPGTGKTLLARAVAGEAGVPFFSMAGPEFMQKYVGESARRVRELFEAARKAAPSIVFIDEIDAIGQKRDSAVGERMGDPQALNQLLIEMDGFNGYEGVVVIAATNRLEAIDEALLRPGRFDRTTHVLLPDARGRRDILEAIIKGRAVPVAQGVDLMALARATSGFSGADLQGLVNEAVHAAVRRNGSVLDASDFDAARDRVVMGSKSPRVIMPDELRTIAVHEAGHAIVSLGLPLADPIYKVTIISRGDALGMVSTAPDEERFMASRAKLIARIAVLLAGRLAEEAAFGNDDVTTGASNDLSRATELAYEMVTNWGFGRRRPNLSRFRVYSTDGLDGSEALTDEIRQEIDAIIEEARTLASDVLTKQADKHRLLVEVLLERETLTRDEIEKLLCAPSPDSATDAAKDEAADEKAGD